MNDVPGIADHCRHCGAPDPHLLGRCKVCGLTVCTHCGNSQHRGGEKIVVHDACLSQLEDDGFSMIKFVE